MRYFKRTSLTSALLATLALAACDEQDREALTDLAGAIGEASPSATGGTIMAFLDGNFGRANNDVIQHFFSFPDNSQVLNVRSGTIGICGGQPMGDSIDGGKWTLICALTTGALAIGPLPQSTQS